MRYSDRQQEKREIDPKPDCPACGEEGSVGEYGFSCRNDRCRVNSFSEEADGYGI